MEHLKEVEGVIDLTGRGRKDEAYIKLVGDEQRYVVSRGECTFESDFIDFPRLRQPNYLGGSRVRLTTDDMLYGRVIKVTSVTEEAGT